MASDQQKNLRNEDFRKLLSTPHTSSRGSHSASGKEGESGGSIGDSRAAFTHRQSKSASHKSGQHKSHRHKRHPQEKEQEGDIFDESQTRLNEIMKQYRDRAAERRRGEGPDDQNDAILRAKMAAAYRSVPATFTAAASQAERRRLEIQESKFLGGDMEHTHLVKGLDYSLLNKVRSEMEENEAHQELQQVHENELNPQPMAIEAASENKMVRNLCHLIGLNRNIGGGAKVDNNNPPARNELFAKGRMAYIVELGEEAAGADDVPATLMRSAHECPDTTAESINSDAVVINKLIQVLAYLRSDPKKRRQMTQREGDVGSTAATQNAKSASTSGAGREASTSASGMKIFDDVDDYAPSSRTSASKRRSEVEKSSEAASNRRSYFESGRGDDRPRRSDRDRSRERERDRDRSRSRERESERERRRPSSRERRREESSRAARSSQHPSQEGRASTEKQREVPVKESAEALTAKRRRLEEEEAYAELYPMGMGMVYAGGDSDDEAEDLSKVDLGNKKGPVKRWDFETQRDFEQYQSSREAVPKAAFQYGVKGGENKAKMKKLVAAEKAAVERKLDRELVQINKMLDDRKRKSGGNKPK